MIWSFMYCKRVVYISAVAVLFVVSDRTFMQYYFGIIGIGVLGSHVYEYLEVGSWSTTFSVYGAFVRT